MEAAALADQSSIASRPQRGPGRPSLLTPAVAAQIIFAIEQGNYLEPALESAGVSRSTARHWIKRGHEDKENGVDSEYSRFLEEVLRAQAVAESNLVKTVVNQAPADWRAGAFVLERRWRERWGKNEQPQAANVTIVLADTQQSALLELLRISQAKPVSTTVDDDVVDRE